MTRSIRRWSDDVEATLQDCFASSDWNMLRDSSNGIAPLHPSISTCTFIFCTSINPVINCYIIIISPLWPIYFLTSLILPHLHTLYIDFFYCINDCTFVYSMCNSVLLFVSHLLCFILASCK